MVSKHYYQPNADSIALKRLILGTLLSLKFKLEKMDINFLLGSINVTMATNASTNSSFWHKEINISSLRGKKSTN